MKKKNFWLELKNPFFALAPLDDVTDVIFREVVTKISKPDVLFTEFTNVDGLQSNGRKALLPRLKFTNNQKPIVAQIWGKDPSNYLKTAQELVQMGFDGIDINMGCPQRDVIHNGCCSALIEDHQRAKEIIEATIKGANGLPVSVKTRCGLKDWRTEEWISFLLQFDLSAITVHGRIAKEMSKNPANWQEIKKAVDIKNKLSPKVLILGNGDVQNYEDGLEKINQSGVDGVMIGRGIFSDIQAFTKTEDKKELNLEDRLNLLLMHTQMFISEYEDTKNFAILKKFFKIYISGFEGAVDMRSKFMDAKNLEDIKKLVKKYKKDLSF